MKYTLLVAVLISLLIIGCQGEKEKQYDLEGSWEAVWSTDPAAFEGVSSDMEFVMYGEFSFEEEKLTVVANGYPGCIFGEDTLSHTQKWEISGDTLYLISDENVRGISYQINEMTDTYISMNLVQDIEVTLSRK
jgi:hypothetical protein